MQALAGACPPCSFYSPAEQRCVWCPTDPAIADPIPECFGCNGRTPLSAPWYRDPDVMVPVLTGIGGSIVGALAIAWLSKRLSI